MPTNKPNSSNVGSERDDFIAVETLNLVEQKGIEFKLKCIDLINSRGVSASGKLIDSISDPEMTSSGGVITMRISFADYYDYTNKGVKGWKDSSKAPNSPYQYKTKGMSKAGVKSITQYITSGSKKTVRFAKYGAYKELEQKFSKNPKKLIDFQIKNAVFGIKRYGIEAKHWFDDAVKEVFGDFEEVMAEQLGNVIAVSINIKGKK